MDLTTKVVYCIIVLNLPRDGEQIKLRGIFRNEDNNAN